MPKEPINYSKSIIYKIYCNNPEVKEIYIGSTTNFKNRKNQHKNTCYNKNNNAYNLKKYSYIRDNGGWDNFSMIPIIEYPCENKFQLMIKEEEYRKELKATLNFISNICNCDEPCVYTTDRKKCIKCLNNLPQRIYKQLIS
jgi:hypothetical protein